MKKKKIKKDMKVRKEKNEKNEPLIIFNLYFFFQGIIEAKVNQALKNGTPIPFRLPIGWTISNINVLNGQGFMNIAMMLSLPKLWFFLNFTSEKLKGENG